MIYNNIIEFNYSLPPEGRLLGLDVGTKKIGLAISDFLRSISTPYNVLLRKNKEKDVAFLKALIEENNATGIVMGLPIQMNGIEGESCKVIREFAEQLSELTISIYLQDERLSTAAVKRVLADTNYTRKKKEAIDDKLAASYILQSALDQINYAKKQNA